MSNVKRVGIIGYGAMGKMWAEVLSGMSEVAQPLMIAEPNKERQREAYRARYGCVVFDSAERMIIHSRPHTCPHVVIVATHVPLHYEYVSLALEHGCHVICEKPMALSLEECDAMVTLAKEKKLKLAINHQSIFSRAIMVADAKIAAGDIGELYAIKAYGKGRIACSDLMEIAGHLLHLMWYFAHNRVVEVFGDVTRHGRSITLEDASRIKDLYPEGRDSGIGAGDHMFGYYKFANGIRGELHLDALSGAPDTFTEKIRESRNYGYYLELLGTAGRMQLYLPRTLFFNVSPLDDLSKKATPWVEVDPSLREDRDPVLMKALCEHFLGVIEHDGYPVVSGEIGRLVMEMSLGVYASHFAGRPLTLPLVDRKHPFTRT